MNKVKINIKDQPNNLVTMTDDQLLAEHARLKAGTVGEGFDMEHMPQILEMVEKEMKKRKLKIKEETK
jgi:hypothetical protein